MANFTKSFMGADRPSYNPVPVAYISITGELKRYTNVPGFPKPIDFSRIATYEERIANAGKANPPPVIVTQTLPPETIGQKTSTIKKSFVDRFFDGINAFLTPKAVK